ncbi:hypothetical protein OPV22_007542 [Ensete ventricosum]|uniref:Remorin C-terminal domain-containing protein n=1 Tax=Ensete ventricosum TaxID=4639 RepID=A0AAV8RTQ0_ENSVE|nr:hypothetical protein OPV22_007542 [Ensete ventricosum]
MKVMKLSDISNLNLQLISSTSTVLHLQSNCPISHHRDPSPALPVLHPKFVSRSWIPNLKTGRLKQAKDEAEREAAAYRASLEEDYLRKVSESTACHNSSNLGSDMMELLT